MASNFITAADVLDIAFENKNLLTGKISDVKIKIAELAWIKPPLTEGLYNRLNQANSGLEPIEVTLKGKIKEALAFYVAYECIPSMNMPVTNKGAQLLRTDYSEVVSAKERMEQRETYKRQAGILMDDIIAYIEDEANYNSFKEYYVIGDSTNNTMGNNHGIIFSKTSAYKDLDEYYFNNPS